MIPATTALRRAALVVVALAGAACASTQGQPATTTEVRPAPSKFHQEVSYRIEALLDDEAEVLHGRARMRYANRSAETLDTLWFHLYLNAFRPNSAWAQRELEFGNRRFQDLGPDEWGFQHLTSVTVDGRKVEPVFPGAPDSTVVAIPLPTPIAPGGEIVVDIDFDARPSSLPRRQGRQGRQYDFAHWFPAVAVFDTSGWNVRPHLPQGEFYGEFMDFDVTMDVAADQVIGATGVPVEGDPGWEAAAAPGYADSTFYLRDVYGAVPQAEDLGLLGAPKSGRKQVRWIAKDVHNFGWSTSPDYIFEGGMWQDIAIRVLYKPGDDDWANGQALERTKIALAWYDSIFGDFAWPQLTNLHRIEPGGTEFPMVIMDGSASQGLILHEVAHNYAMGILANNEWKEGFLDEGMASFVTNWYFERHGQPDIWNRTYENLALWERSGCSQPVTTWSADFRDFQTYNVMTYTKPSVVYRMLREYLGEDVFIRGLRRYYADNRLTHVTLADFQRAMEQESGQDLDWFFGQWFRTTATLDYAITDAATSQGADGSWTTRVTVTRTGEAWMPVTLEVDGTRVQLDSRERTQTVEVTTPTRPEAAVLDPDIVILDIDRENNRMAVR